MVRIDNTNMIKKKYKQTQEHRNKIGRANSIKMKKYWKESKASIKQKNMGYFVKESIKQRKQKLGYVNSPETRKKLSKIMKEKWRKGEVTEKQKSIFGNGKVMGGFKTRFKKGHNVPDSWRLAVKKNRAKQIFPMKDSSIEVKIQNFLKELKIEFFTHQYIKIEYSYQCDILIPSMNLVIECDGDYWHKYPIGKDIDHVRTKELIEKGFKVLRIWEREIKVMDVNDFRIKIEGKINGRM